MRLSTSTRSGCGTTLRFAADRCFDDLPEEARRITARDVLYSILRIADRRNHSPVYWLFRGKIRGLDAFHEADAPDYDAGIEGFRILDDLISRFI